MANPISNRPSFAFQAPRGGRPQGVPGQDDDNNRPQGPQRNGNADATQEGQGPGRGGGQCNRGGGDDGGGGGSEDTANQDRGRGPLGGGDIPQGGLESRTNFMVMQRFRGRRGGGDGENTEAPPNQAAPNQVQQDRTLPTDNQIPDTTGSGDISMARLSKAANGVQQIIQALLKIAQDPQGAKALSIALDKGTTFKMGQLDGNTAGITAFATGQPPAITLERLETDVVAHEIAHAAYPDMAHEAVYEFGRQVARDLGETPIT